MVDKVSNSFSNSGDFARFFKNGILRFRHRPKQEEIDANQDPRFQKLLANRILTEAFVELLEWDYDYHGWPETIAMDATRILSLRDQVERAAVSTAVILLTFSNISGFVIPAHAQTLKVIIKKHIDILLEDFKEDPDLLRYFFMITIFMKLPFIHYQELVF